MMRQSDPELDKYWMAYSAYLILMPAGALVMGITDEYTFVLWYFIAKKGHKNYTNIVQQKGVL